MERSTFGDRMKGYEAVSQLHLVRRTPVIIRLDGRAFHTWAKRLKKIDPILEKQPYSDVMIDCMMGACTYLTHYIQGAVFTYSQSDEISIFLRDWDTLEFEPWFADNVQKIVSISASMATLAFYAAYERYEKIDYAPHRPMFDSRVFNVPKEEVANYFIWRQKDAIRNSVNMLGQFHFSQKELHGKKVDDVKKMLYVEGVDWEGFKTPYKRGFCVPKKMSISSASCQPDYDIPVFTENREYIEKWLTNYDGEM